MTQTCVDAVDYRTIKKTELSFREFYPLPDEHIFSIIARYQRRTGSWGNSRTLDALFGDVGKTHKSKRLRFDSFLLRLGILTQKEKFEYLDKTTFLPLGRLWRDVDRETLFVDDILHRDDNPIMGSNLNLGSNVNNVAEFRFCPKCVESDIYTYGVDYWHRVHQVEGVAICSLHGEILRICTEKAKKKRNNFFSRFWLPSDLIQSAGDSVTVISDEVMKKWSVVIKRQADISAFLLNTDRFLTYRCYWEVIKLRMSEHPHGSPAAIEKGLFFKDWSQYMKGLAQLGSVNALHCINSKSDENWVLFTPWMSAESIALVAFLYETPQRLFNVLKSITPHARNIYKLDWETKGQVIAWLEHGLSITEIANRLCQDPIDVWAAIRLAHLVPNEAD